MNRLPTRAEWEQGARARTLARYTTTPARARSAVFTGILAGSVLVVVACLLMP